jgi:hypothetical protein
MQEDSNGGGGGGGGSGGGSDGGSGRGGGGGGGGGSNGGGVRPEVRVEIGVTRMQVRVPCIQIGEYLAQSRAMHLANVQIFGSQCLASKQSSICAADRFICVRR